MKTTTKTTKATAKNEQYYTVLTSDIVRETEKAYLVRLQIAYKKVYTDTQVWVPKSRTKIEKNKLFIEKWVVQKSDAAQELLAHYHARHKARLIKVLPFGY